MLIRPDSLRDVAARLNVAAAAVESAGKATVADAVGDPGLVQAVEEFEKGWSLERSTLHGDLVATAAGLLRAADFFQNTDQNIATALTSGFRSPERNPNGAMYRR